MKFTGISKEKRQKLFARMKRLGVKDEDITEKFIRSSGAGGQNVNKVSTCVFLRHVSSGISVKCQDTRSQSLNRFIAFNLLLDKIENQRNSLRRKKIQEAQKRKRQNRKRTKKSKENMLLSKRQRSEKKKTRRPIKSSDADSY